MEKIIVSISFGKDNDSIYSEVLKKLMSEPQMIFINKDSKLCSRVDDEKIILNPEIKIFENKERRSEFLPEITFDIDYYGIKLSIV